MCMHNPKITSFKPEVSTQKNKFQAADQIS